ncbi:MAG: type IV pilus modification protein PilV [Nevskia sp.]|nr:type IV pilus modification protein PilV [Nevskia sp.]
MNSPPNPDPGPVARPIPQGERGFTLLEVLIAVVVLSIGILGVSKLMFTAIKSNDDAAMRMRATILANAIMDSMRANYAGSTTGLYDVAHINAYASSASCVGAVCSATQIAQSDLANWKTLLSNALPLYDGTIVTDTNNNYRRATVTVWWDASRAGTSAPAAGSGQLTNASAGCTATANSTCMMSVTLESIIQ